MERLATELSPRNYQETQLPGLAAFSFQPTLQERVEQKKLALPEDHKPFTDKYFLRANEILKALGVNPWIRGQVFIRRGPGELGGVEEAIAVIDRYSNLAAHGGRVFALPEHSPYSPQETLMIIEGPAQDLIELETMYLGVLAGETTRLTDGVASVDLDEIKTNVAQIRALIGERLLIEMGARHRSWRDESEAGRAAIEAGASVTSTDVGSQWAGKRGVGTIPHALENIFAYYYGKADAVRQATLAFDRVIDPDIPRVALVDYNNREIDDSLSVARALKGKTRKPFAVRLDTCGENLAQGAFASQEDLPEGHELRAAAPLIPAQDKKYWFGNGVCVSGVLAVRRALDAAGLSDVQLVLSSGFAKPDKVRAFVTAERILGVKLFDAIGVGELFSPCRSSKMDIVAVADREEELDHHPISKAGRKFRPNPKLELALGHPKAGDRAAQ